MVCDSAVFVEKMEQNMVSDYIAREERRRTGSGYPSAMTDREWVNRL